jgi:hypothetical protein
MTRPHGPFSRHAAINVLPLLVALAAGCVGTIGGDGDGQGGAGHAGVNPATGDPSIAAACSADYAPGHVPIHRLTNVEYNNTVRDLVFTATTPADHFDSASPGLSGFSNDSDGLQISDNIINNYYLGADALAKEVISTKGKAGGAYSKIVTCAPTAAGCAKSTIAAFGARAFRRPLTSDELAGLVAVHTSAGDFDAGLHDVLTSMLVSPKFTFVYSSDARSQTAGAVFALDNYALASRLSYALWQSMPDAELMQAAKDGTLSSPEVLEQQVIRMAKDPRIGNLILTLRNDFLGLTALADPAGTLQGLDDGVRASMVGEVDAVINDVVKQNRSFLELITSTTTLADKATADLYGVSFTGSDPATPQKISLPANRRGIVTSPAVLTATAGATNYTHPVKRGKWVTEKITCTPPPPAPAVLPPLNLDPNTGTTPRQKLEEHVRNEPCHTCHVQMDAAGLGLENFDVFGKWRDSYGPGLATIDATGALLDGTKFTNPGQMYDALAKESGTSACLAQQIMAYALTRATTTTDDACVSHAIGAAAVTPTSSFTELLTKVVRSRQFFMQTGEAP